jgi:shikimate 5-dehydrogenase
MSQPATVAFVGLGNMGRAMSARLLRAGFDLTVWNRTASRADEVEHQSQTQDSTAPALTGLAGDRAPLPNHARTPARATHLANAIQYDWTDRKRHTCRGSHLLTSVASARRSSTRWRGDDGVSVNVGR